LERISSVPASSLPKSRTARRWLRSAFQWGTASSEAPARHGDRHKRHRQAHATPREEQDRIPASSKHCHHLDHELEKKVDRAVTSPSIRSIISPSVQL